MQLAAQRIRAGKLVAFPTETVYGLGADATSTRAVQRVFRAKGRPSNNPLIVHVASVQQAKQVVSVWPKEASMLARAFWPGPLTMVLPKAKRVSKLATAGQESVGVRCPDHPVARALLRACDVPLVGPSANMSGSVSPTQADDVRAAFDEDAVMVLDGGPCKVGIESTVVSLLGCVDGSGAPVVLRPGVISQADIDRVLGVRVKQGRRDSAARKQTASKFLTKRNTSSSGDNSGPLLSPGLLTKHYAPKIPLEVVPTLAALQALLRKRMQATKQQTRGKAKRVPTCLVIAHCAERSVKDLLMAGDGFGRMPKDARQYAQVLYHALHQTLWFERMVLLAPPSGGAASAVWEAIHDRLRRASAKG